MLPEEMTSGPFVSVGKISEVLRGRIEDAQASLLAYVHYNRDKEQEARLLGKVDGLREALNCINHIK